MTGPDPADGGVVVIALEATTARALLRVLAAAVEHREDGLCEQALTPRESEVMARLSAGKGYGEIAAELVIDLETVRTHARRIRRKLGVATSRELLGLRAPDPAGAVTARGGATQITP